VPGVERLVDAFPARLRRALATRVTELGTDLRAGALVHEADDPAPRLRLLLAPETGAARCDSRFRRDAQHLAHHEPGAAERTRPQVDQVEVADVAVARRVHVHRRDDDPVLE